MDNKSYLERDVNKDTIPTPKRTKYLPPILKPEDYKDELVNFSLTKDQELELLQTIWDIMKTMVDIGWGVDTVRLVLPELFKESSQDSEKMLPKKEHPEKKCIQQKGRQDD